MNALSSFLWIGLQLIRIVLALMLAGWAFHECAQGLASDKWPSVNGKVTTSVVKKVAAKYGQRDETDVRYQYVVKGKTYTSNRVQFGGEMFSNPVETVNRYKVDKQVAVHYKQEDPSVSCLQGGFNQLSVLPCFAAALFFAFLAISEDGKSKDDGFSFRSKTDLSSSAIRTGERKESKVMVGVILPVLLMLILVFGVKFGIESVFSHGVSFGSAPFNAIAANVALVVIVFLAGLAFVFFLTSLPMVAALLMRAKKLELAEMVAKLNTALSCGMSPQSFEAAMALGLQAEIAQERLQYEKALAFSKRALKVVADRPKEIPPASEDATDKLLREHMVQYEKTNSPVEALLHESLGCILLDMGLNDEAMSHAKKAKQLAQNCMKNASSAHDSERTKLALAGALTFAGRVELSTGALDEARSDLEEAVKLRQQLPRQFEENLALAMAYLASTYCLQSETRKAERSIDEGLKLVSGSQAPSHCLAKATLMAALAEVKIHDGQFTKAEELLKECLNIREKLLVTGHPEIARTLLAIANLKEAQGRSKDATQHRATASEMLTVCFAKQRQLA